MKYLNLLLIIFSFSHMGLYFIIPQAWAYIDPGTGSVVIQVLIGALVGVGITIKVYWVRIKMKLSSFGKNND